LHNIKIANNDLAQLFVLHSDNTWMKIQKYSKNIKSWKEILSSYDWKVLDNINSLEFEQKIDQYLYPTLINIGAASKFSKLKSNFLKIRSRESDINPDWDCDVVLKLFSFIAKSVGWTPPSLPLITQRIDGYKKKIDLEKVINLGVDAFTKKYKVFSYAITSSKTISYTIFKKL